jgi:hypothetical protein
MITEGSLDYYWPDHDRIENDRSLRGSRDRYKRIDEVYEFRLDRKRLAGSHSTSSPGEELREVFRELEPLPAALVDLLATPSKVGGKLGIRWCSALVKPESAELLVAIREHPKLKGYLEPGAPPGYLLIKKPIRSWQFYPALPGSGLPGGDALIETALSRAVPRGDDTPPGTPEAS